MKTIPGKHSLNRIFLVLALTAAPFVLPPLQAQEKGATRLMKLNALKSVGDVESLEAGDMVVMTCPKCKDTWITVVESTGKTGSPTKESAAVRHECPGCEMKLETQGHGKAKTDKWVHVCKHCGSKDAMCSVLKKGSLPTAGTR